MGAFCDKCQSYQPITQNLTVDQKPARKATDVIGHVLGCGHKFGNEEFMEIQSKVDKVRRAYAELQRKMEEEFKSEIARVLAPTTTKRSER